MDATAATKSYLNLTWSIFRVYPTVGTHLLKKRDSQLQRLIIK